MIVVDTTALSALLSLGAVDVLLETFPSVSFIIPLEVWREIQKANSIKTAANKLIEEYPDNFLIHEANQEEDALVSRLVNGLHRAESEAIAIAKLTGARLITDDLAARKTAKRLNVIISGTLFVIRTAYIRCPIETRTELETLMSSLSRFLWYDRGLENWVLQAEKIELR